MKVSQTISLDEARFIFISCQLLNQDNFVSDKNYLYKIIEQLGYIQIDTISVVERSHHHVLWTRMPAYQRAMLDELIEIDKKIFEYWSHAAAYLPMKDYRYSLIRKDYYYKKYKEWGKANKKITRYVFDRIKSDGPLQSKDFEDYRNKTSGWWDWKPSKDALDFLFHQGKLMVLKRKGFQKVYELTERVLPDNVDTSFPTEKELYKYLIRTAINSHGLASEKEILYLRRYDKKLFSKTLNELVEDNYVLKIDIKEINNGTYFSNQQNIELLNNKNNLSRMHILSPFDNLVIQRKKLKEFFNFDYQLECYVPEAKRKFGYFCLPVIYGDKFIGKIDAKASREIKTFAIKKFYYEGKVNLNKMILKKLEKKLNEITRFSGCNKIEGIKFK